MPVQPEDILFIRQLERQLEDANSKNKADLLINDTIDDYVGRQWAYKTRLAQLEDAKTASIDPGNPFAPLILSPEGSKRFLECVWLQLNQQQQPETYEAACALLGTDQCALAQLQAVFLKQKRELIDIQIKTHQENRAALGEGYLTHFSYNNLSYANPFPHIWDKLKTKGSFISDTKPQSSQEILDAINEITDVKQRLAVHKLYNQLLHDARLTLAEISDNQATEERLAQGRSAYNIFLRDCSATEKATHAKNLQDLGETYLLRFSFTGHLSTDINQFEIIWTQLVASNKALAQPASFSHPAILEQIGKLKDKKNRTKALNDYNRLLAERRSVIASITLDKHKTNIDRVALGLDEKEEIPGDAFIDLWQVLAREMRLVKPAGKGGHDFPEHHTDLLDWIKSNFDQNKLDTLTPGEWAAKHLERLGETFSDDEVKESDAYYSRYYVVRNKYYELLKRRHLTNGKLQRDTAAQLAYKLGQEKQLLKNELANKKEDQKLLTHGLFWGRVFALSQGFFVGGGTFGLMTSAEFIFAGMFTGWLMLIPAAVAAIGFYMATRSNWLTINEEMGPLLKALFFDPNLAHVSYPKRMMNMIRRTSWAPKDVWNAMKGSTNLVAGSFIGILTLYNSIGLLGRVGIVGPTAVLAAAVLALTATFVYFVINNINQQLKNNDADWQKADLERLEKLRTITASPNNPLKRYGFNIAVALTGLTGLLLGASVDLFGVVNPLTSLTLGGLLTPIHLTLAALPFSGIITAVFFALALYGITGFYQKRTVGSTEGIIVGDSGLDFGDLKGMKRANLDVTGANAPDFDSVGHPVFGNGVGNAIGKFIFNAGTALFNMDPKRDNSQTVRIGNALGQAMPAFAGAGSTGVSYLLFNYMQVALGIGVGTSWAFIASICVGLVVLGAAAYASYSANSAGLRPVQEKITAVEVLKRDKKIVDDLELTNNCMNEQLFLLGQSRVNTELYIQSRDRTGDRYWNSGYSKQEKLAEAQAMIADMDNFVNSPNEAQQGNMLTFSYAGARSQGDLGRIAKQAGMIINHEFDVQICDLEEGSVEAPHDSTAALDVVKKRWVALDR
jgi:hypothetical protein